jgi:hypothetical protein
MPRKSAKSEVVKTVNSAPVDGEGFYALPKMLLMEYRAMDSEFRHADLSFKVVSNELNLALSKLPEIQKLLAQKAALFTETCTKKNALQEIHHVIEATFKLKINEIAIDDLTGRIHQLVDGKEAPDPLKPPTPEPKIKAGRGAKAKTQ